MNDKPSVEDNCADSTLSTESSKPKNVPLKLWEKFKVLEKRTNDTTKRSTEKRIKHLQKTALENVAKSLNTEDRKIVQVPPDIGNSSKHEPSSNASTCCNGALRKRPLEEDYDSRTDASGKISLGNKREKTEKEWREVRGLMGLNDHLAGVSHGYLGPKTVLELKIESAIAKGDFKTAEELSDHMSNREFGEKVAEAIDAKNFLKHKQDEEDMKKAKQKKKLRWGFEPKHRWETKGNM